MAELKIPLASNEITLRKEDLSRAMFCALAISQEDDVKEVEDKLKQHPDLQFEEIHISDPNSTGTRSRNSLWRLQKILSLLHSKAW